MTESDSGRPQVPRSPFRRWYVPAAIVVAAAGFFIITAGGIGENLVYYWGPSEVRDAGQKAVGATIRLGGQVAPGSIRRATGSSRLEFDVADGKQTVHVVSSGVPPQMFREGIGVVVEGTMTREGFFECSRLMVSHGNEYRPPSEGEKPDVKKLMQSTAGLPREKEPR